jgi:hypothetical protein
MSYLLASARLASIAEIHAAAASAKADAGEAKGLTSSSRGADPAQGFPSMIASQPLMFCERRASSATAISSSLGSLLRPRVTYRPSVPTTTHRRSRELSVSDLMTALWLRWRKAESYNTPRTKHLLVRHWEPKSQTIMSGPVLWPCGVAWSRYWWAAVALQLCRTVLGERRLRIQSA